MRLGSVLVVYQGSSREPQKSTLEKVCAVLTAKGIKHNCIERTRIKQSDFKNKALVIAVGGDGTFLKTSHFIFNNTPLLGVNSNQKEKEGFFTATDINRFKSCIGRIIKNKHKKITLLRLEAWINKKRIKELALNEVFVGRRNAYCTARYTIKVGKQKELQRSSGVIIATPAGSCAWALSAGGKKMPLASKKFQLVVREPYQGRLSKKRIKNKMLSNKQTVEVCSEMGLKVVVIDSLSAEYSLKLGDVLKVKASKHNLTIIK